MPNLNVAALDDLVAGTLENWDAPGFQMIAQQLQEYVVMPKWLKKNRLTFEGGESTKRNLMLKRNRTADRKFMFATVSVGVPNLLSTTTVEWVHLRDSYAYDLKEALINKGSKMLTNVLEPRRANTMLNMAESLEEDAFQLRDSADEERPNGIPYYVVPDASYTAAGFNGKNPSGHSTCAGIDASSSTNANWRNWTDEYTAVTRDDLLKKMRTALRKTKFAAAIATPSQYVQAADKYCLYMREQTINDFEDLLDAQNDNHGADVGKYMDKTVFQMHPLTWVPQMEESTFSLASRYPIYFINHDTFQMIVLEGDYLRQQGPMPAASQPDVREVHMSITYKFLCIDRRRNGIILKAA